MCIIYFKNGEKQTKSKRFLFNRNERIENPEIGHCFKIDDVHLKYTIYTITEIIDTFGSFEMR